jgi:hypothetical protein
MSQEGKRGEVKPVSFKMPMHVYAVVQAAAAARGVDVSSVLNWIIAQHLPTLVRAEAQRESSMLIARAQGLADAVEERLKRIAVEEGGEAAAQELLGLLQRLQIAKDERPAAKAA